MMMAKSSSPSPRVPPARTVARGRPPMEVKGAVVVSWSLVLVLGATTATRLGSPYPYHLRRPS